MDIEKNGNRAPTPTAGGKDATQPPKGAIEELPRTMWNRTLVDFKTAPLQVEYGVAAVPKGPESHGKSTSFGTDEDMKGSKGSANQQEPPKTGQGNPTQQYAEQPITRGDLLGQNAPRTPDKGSKSKGEPDNGSFLTLGSADRPSLSGSGNQEKTALLAQEIDEEDKMSGPLPVIKEESEAPSQKQATKNPINTQGKKTRPTRKGRGKQNTEKGPSGLMNIQDQNTTKGSPFDPLSQDKSDSIDPQNQRMPEISVENVSDYSSSSSSDSDSDDSANDYLGSRYRSLFLVYNKQKDEWQKTRLSEDDIEKYEKKEMIGNELKQHKYLMDKNNQTRDQQTNVKKKKFIGQIGYKYRQILSKIPYINKISSDYHETPNEDYSDLTDQRIAEVKKEFSKFDKFGTGTISTKDVGPLLKTLGKQLSDSGLKKIMDDFDADDNGTIDFPEFLSMLMSKEMNSKQNNMTTATHMKSQFNLTTQTDDEERELRDKLQENLTSDVINIQMNSQPRAEIVPGKLYWQSLGPYTLCDIDGCQEKAYQVCNKEITHFGFIKLWQGCERKMCMSHCRLRYAEDLHGEYWLKTYHCKDPECWQRYKKANQRDYLAPLLLYFFLSLIMLIIILV